MLATPGGGVVSRYVPTAEERAAIDALTLAGYAVVRQGTYDNLRKRIDQMEWEREWRDRDMEHSRRWAEKCRKEERRIMDRLNDVVAAAAAQGVSIQAINDALHKAASDA